MTDQVNWVPCVFEFGSKEDPVHGSPHAAMGTGRHQKVALTYSIPLATTRPHGRLHLSGVKIGLTKADGGNNISRIQVRGVNTMDREAIWDEEAVHAAPQEIVKSFGPVDCSRWSVVKVHIWMHSNAPNEPRISFVAAKFRYVQ
jgi:hypothetical protein